MNIRAADGGVELPELGLVITPQLSRSGFLELPVAARCTINVKNEPWCSWRLPPIPLDDAFFFATLFFNGERLHFISMAVADAKGPDPERENERHHHLLRDVWQAPPGDYSWGLIWAGIDPRSDYANFSLGYVRARDTIPKRIDAKLKPQFPVAKWVDRLADNPIDAKLRQSGAGGCQVLFVLGASFLFALLFFGAAWLWIQLHSFK